MKKLVLKKSNRKLTGLCAGLADYFDIDVSIVRLVMLAFTLASAIIPGVLFYIIASLITPEEGKQDG